MFTHDVQELYEKIGSLISKARKPKGLTQAQLADQVSISRASIVNIERGRHRTSIHLLYKIAAALDLSPGELLPPIEKTDNSLPPEIASKVRPSERAFIAKVIKPILKEVHSGANTTGEDQAKGRGTVKKGKRKSGPNFDFQNRKAAGGHS